VRSIFSNLYDALFPVPDYDRIIKNIEKGESKISRKDEIMKAIAKKMDRYKNPWLELKIQYGQNKGKLYNEECDRFLVNAHATTLYQITEMLDIINEPFLLYSYAWCTNLAMETGKN
jgi:hypothetical protein